MKPGPPGCRTYARDEIQASTTTIKATITPMSPRDEVKYLGLKFNWKGRVTPKHTCKLQNMLLETSKALLKPYHRLILLKTFIVPKLTYELVLGFAHRNTLKKLDIPMRVAVRKWFRLPKDTTLGFLHASIPHGGIAIPCLSAFIPLLQKARFTKILNSANDTFAALCKQKSFHSIKRAMDLPCRIFSTAITTKQEAQEAWREALFNASDGKELNTPALDPASHSWLKDPSNVFFCLHLRGIQLRGGLLPSKSCNARGTSQSVSNILCRGNCQQVETLNHIPQRCETTHNSRCTRRNRIMRKVDQFLGRKDWSNWVEPIIPATESFIKPNLIACDEHQLFVMDVSVFSGLHLSETWDIKIKKIWISY